MSTRNCQEIQPESSRPSQSELFRLAMRGWASTVAVVASAENGVRGGIVATAIASISMEPASLMVAVNRSASCHGLLLRRRALTVNFLRDEQAEYAAAFCSKKAEDRFSTGDWQWSCGRVAAMDGLPYLEDAQASLFCIVEDLIDSHTHSLIFGRVVDVRLGAAKEPLLYCDGHYGRFEPHPPGVSPCEVG